MKEIVAKEQAGDIGIWGKVERVAGIRDRRLRPLDHRRRLLGRPAPDHLPEEGPDPDRQRDPPRLCQGSPRPRSTAGPSRSPRPPTRSSRSGGNKAPNLVKGDFEQGRECAPRLGVPCPHDVTWVPRTGKERKTSKNRVIRFTMNEEVAGTTGVLYYSDFFPVEEGATYRFQCRWRSTGSAAKVFIKCYDELPTEFRGRPGAGRSTTEKREVYRSQQNLEGSPGVWNVQTEDFTPQHTQFTPRWGRVMLYAYWPAGTVEWDDVVVKQIAPAVAGPGRKGEKDRRPSSKTKARSKGR